MLKRFSVKNFKAFEDKVTLDLSSIGNYEFNKECISNGICKQLYCTVKTQVGNHHFALHYLIL